MTILEKPVIGAGGKVTMPKDPREVLEYVFDWTDYLDNVGEFVASASVVFDDKTDLVLVAIQPIDGYRVSVRVSGGKEGMKYRLGCEITTTGTPADVAVRSIWLKVANR